MARKSKLAPFEDKLGIVPDKELAELAGVTFENVRAYRKRRGIPASWRGEGKPSPTTKTKADKPRSPASKRKGGRRSKLEAYTDFIGIVPDAQLAQVAGISINSAWAYRKRRNIPARWRGEGEPVPNEEALRILFEKKHLEGQGVDEELPPEADDALTPSNIEEEPLPAQAGAIPSPEAEPADPTGNALPVAPEPPDPQPVKVTPTSGYEVTLKHENEESRYVVMGKDIAEAAAKAVAGVEKRGLEGKLVEIRFIAEALIH